MFGPNVKSDERGVYYHHREEMFRTILRAIEQLFIHKFGLEEYRILFITGSGTTVNESVIFGFRKRFRFLFDDATFGRRLADLGSTHSNDKLPQSNWVAYPYYETSNSRLNLYKGDVPTFLDMVSAFPYYLPPKGTKIWTTVSSKQLGAYPVLGIVGIHKSLDLDEMFVRHQGSSLCLLDHLDKMKEGETPHTPAIPLYYDLLQSLAAFQLDEFRQKIGLRRRRVLHYIGVENVIGGGPVITFIANTKKLKRAAEECNLYKNSIGYQIFLWSGTDEEYDTFFKILESD